MDITLFVLAFFVAGTLGYVTGRWHGYIDALPKRDDTGRFKKKD
jgi:hypothetical protein